MSNVNFVEGFTEAEQSMLRRVQSAIKVARVALKSDSEMVELGNRAGSEGRLIALAQIVAAIVSRP